MRGPLCQAVLFSAPLSALADICRYEWEVREHVVDYLRPMDTLGDGKPVPPDVATSAAYFNDLYPGPVLDCMENDDVEVLVVNKLTEQGAIIHWHGLYMNNETWDAPTPWADGVHRFTHAPIQPGTNYTYRFKAWPPGTHFWHSHMDAMQDNRGIRGAIVIRKREDRYRHLYDEDMVIMISDARRRPPIDLMLDGQAMDVGNPAVSEINILNFNGFYGNGSAEYPYPQIEVEAGKCYRFRFIQSAGNAQSLQTKIAGHDMTMIALDGLDIHPINVTGFNIHVGERMDAIFCADQEPGNYLINATYDLACDLAKDGVGWNATDELPFVPLPPLDSCMFYAFIKYKGHDEVPKNVNPKRHGGQPEGTGGGKGLWCDSLDENGPQPTADRIHFDISTQETGWKHVRNVDKLSPEPEKADLELTIFGGIVGPDDGFKVQPGGHNKIAGRGQFGLPVQAGWSSRPTTPIFTKGGRTYISTRKGPREFWSMSPHWPSTPILHTQNKCGTNGANVIDVPEDAKNIELTLVNLSPSAHVFHLHGMHFQVINYGFPEWCNYENHWVCFFMPFQVGQEVAKHTINGTAHIGDPKNPNMGGPFYWGIEPDKNHPNYLKTLNLEAPVRRDMLSIWRHQWAVIRIRPLNPGVWVLHCHMSTHIPSGMMTALNVLPSKQPPIPLDTPSSGHCPVHGWNHTIPAEPTNVTAALDVFDWTVDYQRPTREGSTWATKRLEPNQIEPKFRSFMLLANGVFPGTTLEAREGDTVNYKVINSGFSEPLAIHWHGQEMRGTPWADGVYGVTQAGILPNNNHTYVFSADTVGTHIYVGDTDTTMGARGLKGTLIVRPKVDLRKDLYDEELLMQISDAWREPEVCLNYDGNSSKPVCPPIDKVTFDGAWGDGSKHYPLPKYSVKPGKCYRLRMVGLMSQVSRLFVSIGGHNLTLLAVDGTDVQPLEVSSIALHAGERYDFRLCATESGPWRLREKNFLITAEAPELCDEEYLKRVHQPAPATCSFRALLSYKGLLQGGAQKSSPPRHEAQALDLGTSSSYMSVKPLEMPPTLNTKPDFSVKLFLGSLENGQMYLDSARRPWSTPAAPLLMTKAMACAEGTPVIEVPENAMDVELVIENELEDLQVAHLHGTRFQVMTVAEQGALHDSPAPLLRDTVVVPARGIVVLRMLATNPGFWALHTLSANARQRGAATVLSVLPSKLTPVPDYVPRTICPSELTV